MRPRACSRKASRSSSNVTPPVTVIALVVGPIEPATNRGRSGVENASAASRPMLGRGAVDLVRRSRKTVLGEHDRREPKVFVSTMSAPASR